MTKKEYQAWMNELDVPFEDLKSNGGRIPDGAKLGDWTRRNDPVAFQVGWYEINRERHP